VEVHGIPEPAGWKDALTGLEGPDAWHRTLVAEVARAARYGHDLTVVVLEVEGILELQDELGEAAARHALRETSEALRREARASDLCMRIGLTRLGVVLPDTGEIAAINFVERVREAMPVQVPAGMGRLRLSFGWASPRAGESADVVVRRADRRLAEDLLRQL
jgi:diguanylate cyclase (GGDEF)-like protein